MSIYFLRVRFPSGANKVNNLTIRESNGKTKVRSTLRKPGGAFESKPGLNKLTIRRIVGLPKADTFHEVEPRLALQGLQACEARLVQGGCVF